MRASLLTADMAGKTFIFCPLFLKAIANISTAEANKELLVVYGLLGLAKEALSYADNRPNKVRLSVHLGCARPYSRC